MPSATLTAVVHGHAIGVLRFVSIWRHEDVAGTDHRLRRESCALALLFLPHLHERIQAIVISQLLGFEVVECLPRNLLHMSIFAISEEVFDSRYETGVEMLGERSTWIVDENSCDHDRIILGIAFAVVVFGQEARNGARGLMCCGGTRLSSVHDGRKVEVFVAGTVGVGCTGLAESNLHIHERSACAFWHRAYQFANDHGLRRIALRQRCRRQTSPVASIRCRTYGYISKRWSACRIRRPYCCSSS
jgi:hypothetical protein